jgi:hypothetical protein
MEDNPGLTAKLDEILEKGYRYGRRGAIKETQLPNTVFPVSCPYSWRFLLGDNLSDP